MDTRPRAVISLFDLTGEAVKPWAKTHTTFQFDAQHPDGLTVWPPSTMHRLSCRIGGDASTWSERIATICEDFTVKMIFGFPPCTDVAVSGARHFAAKARANPNYLAEAMGLVYFVRDIGEMYGVPYMIENPISVISTQWRKPDHRFDPCNYGGYLPEDDVSPYPDIIPARDAYTKRTCLWTGNGFVMPERLPVAPEKFQGHNGLNFAGPMWKLGGKSLRTKNIRSATPRGFARAVFQANSA
jgi:hypothetical protein